MKLKTEGLLYAIMLTIIIAIIMFGAWIFNIKDITWALVSAVICTELQISQAFTLTIQSIPATILGVTIGVIILLIFGPGYLGIIFGTIIITLVCHYAIPIENNWRVAVVTGVIVLVAAVQEHSIAFAEVTALKRAAEVISGSLIASSISYIFARFLYK